MMGNLSMDWVPVSVRHRNRNPGVVRDLENRLGRSATDEEVAQNWASRSRSTGRGFRIWPVQRYYHWRMCGAIWGGQAPPGWLRSGRELSTRWMKRLELAPGQAIDRLPPRGALWFPCITLRD